MENKPKRPRDANQLAKFIVDMAAGEEPEHEPDTSGQRKGERSDERSYKLISDRITREYDLWGHGTELYY